MLGGMQRRHHYEHAFEAYLRARRVPYVAVDEAKKALLPDGARLGLWDEALGRERTLKSFDFVVYGESTNLLVEVKGRKLGRGAGAMVDAPQRARGPRLESWVNGEDVGALETWAQLFGPGFEAVFVFVYWCQEAPSGALFEETFEHRGRWYAVRAVPTSAYARAMRVRSQRWGTMHVDPRTFDAISGPFSTKWSGARPASREPALVRLEG